MSRSIPPIALLAALIGCDASSTAAPEAASSQAPPPPPPCAELCARASTCGLEAAASLADGGGPKATEALKEAKEQAATQTQRCSERCERQSPEPHERRRAERCLEEAQCSEFLRCLEDEA